MHYSCEINHPLKQRPSKYNDKETKKDTTAFDPFKCDRIYPCNHGIQGTSNPALEILQKHTHPKIVCKAVIQNVTVVQPDSDERMDEERRGVITKQSTHRTHIA